MNKHYLGDGVYLELEESGMIILTTENGIEATNTIYLEPEVYHAMTMLVDGLRGIKKSR
jgi:hypothetical protein